MYDINMSIGQLTAVGAQDKDLTFQPSRTFFQSTYKRHTPFAQEPKTFQFQNAVDYGRQAECTIPRSADLLTKIYLVIDLGELTTDGVANFSPGSNSGGYVNDVGRAIIEEISIEAGSVKYDHLYPEFMHAWEKLSIPKERQLKALTGQHDDNLDVAADLATREQRLYIPLEFWFQRDYASAIPLISLHLTDIKLRVKLKKKMDIISKEFQTGFKSDGVTEKTLTSHDLTNTAQIKDMFLLGEFVYLDDAERGLFAKKRHKYLVNQVQRRDFSIAEGSTRISIPIQFNHPTKEFVLLFRKKSNTDNNKWFNFDGLETGKYHGHAFKDLSITLNNNDRVEHRDPLYFGILQPAEHHTSIPESNKVYVYSFAIAPESNSPSGSLNLSRIENTRIDLAFSEPLLEGMDVLVFARSINMVRIYSGVCSLKWSS